MPLVSRSAAKEVSHQTIICAHLCSNKESLGLRIKIYFGKQIRKVISAFQKDQTNKVTFNVSLLHIEVFGINRITENKQLSSFKSKFLGASCFSTL